MRMPDTEGARLATMIGCIWENRAHKGQQSRRVTKPTFTLLMTMVIILGDDGIVLEGLVVFGIRRLHGAVHAVATRETHPEMLCIVELAVAPALGALRRARPNANEVN